MNNSAVVVKVNSLKEHSNADKLQIVELFGTQVLVGLDVKEGDRLVYVDSNMKMSGEFLKKNNLYRHAELNEDKEKVGFFDDSGRVKCIKLRGELSDGFLFSFDYLNFIDGKVSMNYGEEFTQVKGVKVCEKYIVPSRQSDSGNRKGALKKKVDVPMFVEHWDTSQFMRNKHQIPADTICYIEEKVHGTSHRTGHVEMDVWNESSWWYKLLYKLANGFKKIPHVTKWVYINGTRRVIHTPKVLKEYNAIDMLQQWVMSNMEHKKQAYCEFYKEVNKKDISDEEYRKIFPHDDEGAKKFNDFSYFGEGFEDWWFEQRSTYNSSTIGYHDNTMREQVLEQTRGLLHKGEEIYLELFGHEVGGAHIQKGFPYGTGDGESAPYRAMLYRMSLNNPDGKVVDYSREAVYRKADELGFEKPHLFEKFYYSGSYYSMRQLEAAVIAYAQGQSELAEDTLKEGVVVWFINARGDWTALKYKSDKFRLKESGQKDKGIADPEDIN